MEKAFGWGSPGEWMAGEAEPGGDPPMAPSFVTEDIFPKIVPHFAHITCISS